MRAIECKGADSRHCIHVEVPMITDVKWKPSTRAVTETVEQDGKLVTRPVQDAKGKVKREIAAFNLVATVENEDGEARNLNLATAVNTLDKAADINGLLYGFDDPTALTEKQRATSIHGGMVEKAKEFADQLEADVKFAASRKVGKKAEDKALSAGKFEIKA